MDTGLTELLAAGTPAILLGLTVLGLMVHRELGPFAGLDAPGKWMLTALLGMGLLAFSLKLAVAAALGGAPDAFLRPLLARPSPQRPLQELASKAPLQVQSASRHVWEALPETAPAPSGAPSTPEKIALGRRLFFEKRLSADGSLSCESCHGLEDRAGADGRPTALGIHGQRGARNTPTVWNAAFQAVLFWDGRAPSLEEQAKGPILNPIEMGLPSAAEAERRLADEPGYRQAFARAFGDEAISLERIAQALAAFERTLITPDAPYDRFVRGDPGALDQSQLRGMALFESVGCVLCHRGPNFSDASLLGGQAPFRYFPANPTPFGLKYRLLGEDGKPRIWRVPSLRNVALTGPWLHNGSVASLPEVVRIMASAQLARTGALTARVGDNGALDKVDRSPLNDNAVADIVAFLEALGSDSLRRQAAERNWPPRTSPAGRLGGGRELGNGGEQPGGSR